MILSYNEEVYVKGRRGLNLINTCLAGEYYIHLFMTGVDGTPLDGVTTITRSRHSFTSLVFNVDDDIAHYCSWGIAILSGRLKLAGKKN